MANPYLFNAIGGFGDAFMKSYNAQTEKNRRDAQEDEDRAAAAEDRAWTRDLRARETKKLNLEDQINTEATSGAAPGELEEFEEPAAGPTAAGQQPPTTRKFRIKGTDQTFADPDSAALGLSRYNAPSQRQMRAADRVSTLDFQRGLKMRQDAVVAQQNETALDEATQKQVATVANRVLVESVPFSPNWGSSAVGHMNTIAGREVAKVVPLENGGGFTIQVTGADGKAVNAGTYTNDEAGWTKYIHSSLKRTPSELLAYIDATRRAQMELDAKQRAQDEAENRWRDRQVFADGLRDDNRTQGGSSGRRSGDGSSAPAGSTSDPKVAAQAAADAVTEASKNADGAMKLSPEQLNDARANAERVILANPGMSPNVAAAVATKITQSPDAVKPHLNKKTGRIDGMYEDPQSGDLYKVYAYPASRLTDEDRVAMRQGVREMRAELAAGDAQLAKLVDGLAFGGQDGEKPLADYLVRKNIAAAREQFKAAGKPVPGDDELTRIAAAHVERVAMPMVRGQAGAIRQYGEKPRQEKSGQPSSSASIFGSGAQGGYVPPEGSPAARAAANRRAALGAQQQGQAAIDAKRQAAADEAIKVANGVIASGDPAQAQALQDSPQFESLPREVKLRVRNIVFGRN